jgi:hypothetical protein
LHVSQFGGKLHLSQRHNNYVCPNKKCPVSKLTHPYGELEVDYLMKELAVIDIDGNEELTKHYFQIAYYICWVCSSIRAQYGCS